LKRITAMRGVLGYRLLRTIVFGFLLAVVWPTYENVTQAGTPFSTPKSCGYQGGPACPDAGPDISPWIWKGGSGPIPGAPFNSLAELEAAYAAEETTPPGDLCSVTFTGEGPPVVLSQNYGIVTGNQIELYLDSTFYNGSGYGSQPCSHSNTGYTYADQQRTVTCPTPTTVYYTSSPLVGPYCQFPAATPNPPKQAGCPSCGSGSTPGSVGSAGSSGGVGGGGGGTAGSNSGGADAGSGGTVKGGSVDVANGNASAQEIDYSGVGSNPLRFTRTYNSLAGYLTYTGITVPSASARLMGVAWSADYFQFLVAVSVTDSTTTYNTVYAFRPDGRMLVFNEYNGVYSPDGDVSDSLTQTSSGWQYQTAGDTVETYNSSGQLLSIAKRGQAPLTINYATGAGPGDGPTSVSDAFGHALQFAYLVDATGVTRLSSITDPAGKTISYSYDQNGRLTKVTYADNTTHTYGYDTVYNGWLLISSTDEASVLYASWRYQTFGTRVLSSQNAGGVNAYTYSSSLSGNTGSVTVTDPLGKVRTYNQSLIWGRYRMTGSNGVCPGCVEDASRTYDASGNITSRTDFNGNVNQLRLQRPVEPRDVAHRSLRNAPGTDHHHSVEFELAAAITDH
jgi:YD repeat-containing protein